MAGMRPGRMSTLNSSIGDSGGSIRRNELRAGSSTSGKISISLRERRPLPVRSAAERRAALLRSGLIRGGNTSPAGASSARLGKEAVRVKSFCASPSNYKATRIGHVASRHPSDDAKPAAVRNTEIQRSALNTQNICPAAATPPSLDAKAATAGNTASQQHASNTQQTPFLPIYTRPRPTPQLCLTEAVNNGTTALSAASSAHRARAETEKALASLCRSNAQTSTAAAAAAFLASRAALPPQLLAPLGAISGAPFYTLPPVSLACRCCKEGDGVSGVARADACRAKGAPGVEKAAMSEWTAEGNAAEQLSFRANQEASAAPTARATPSASDLERPAANCSWRRTFLNPHNPRQSPLATSEFTATDPLSTALWRAVTSSAARAPSPRLNHSKPRPGQLHHHKQRESAYQVNHRESVVTNVAESKKEEKRVEQRDACIVSGSIRAALTATRATALQSLLPTSAALSDGLQKLSSRPASAYGAERNRITFDVSAPHSFCLRCAVSRHYQRGIPYSICPAFAAGCFLLPFSRRNHLIQREEIFHCSCITGRADESAEKCSKAMIRDRRSPIEESEGSVRHNKETCGGCCCGSTACRFKCAKENRDGSCFEEEADRSWTCHAVYLHLGMLYTAADVAASASAIAAGKRQSDARTTAAVAPHGAEGSFAERPALGSALLRRALLSSFVTPLRKQLLLQRWHARRADQEYQRSQAYESRAQERRNAPEDSRSALPSSAAVPDARRQQLLHTLSEPMQVGRSRLCSHQDVDSSQLCILSGEKRRNETEERKAQEVESQDDNENQVKPPMCVTVWCLDGVAQLQLRQWKAAARELSNVLASAASAAVAHARSLPDVKQRTTTYESRETGPCFPVEKGPAVGVGYSGMHATNPAQKRGAEDATASAAAECRKTETAARAHRILLLLWKPSQSLRGGCDATADSAAGSSQLVALWKEVCTWKQQVRGLYPGVRVTVLSKGENEETEAYEDMMRYLTKERSVSGNNCCSPVPSQQQHPRPDIQPAEQQQTRGSLREEPRRYEQQLEILLHKGWQHAPESEDEYYHEQAEQQQRHNASRHDFPQPEPPELQRKGGHQYQALERSQDSYQEKKTKDQHSQQLNDYLQAGVDRASETTTQRTEATHAIKHKPSKGAVVSRPTETLDYAEGEKTEVQRGCEAFHSTRRRHRNVLGGASKKAGRSCMLFLCGNSFITAPSLSAGCTWGKVKSFFPRPLRHFVRELEDNIYIPMVLRSRFGRRGRLCVSSRSAAAGDQWAGSGAAADSGKSDLWKRQCERLLQWGDDLLPPPRVLVHSSNLRGGDSRSRDSNSSAVAQQQRSGRAELTVPLDGGFSPQQLFQLLGERYSQDVQTFLLPVGALASPYVGQTEEKLRRLLREAAAAAPAVLVLLGLDYLAARRQFHGYRESKPMRSRTRRQPVRLNAERTRPPFERPNKLSSMHIASRGKPLRQPASCQTALLHTFQLNNKQTQWQDQGATEAVRREQANQRQVPRSTCVAEEETNLPEPARQVEEDWQTQCHESRSGGRRTSAEGARMAKSVHTAVSGEEEEYEEEQFTCDSRRNGGGGVSSLRRRLLAALLVGLDEVEDRRRYWSALQSSEEQRDAAGGEETEYEDTAETKAVRQWRQQRAGLAIVGICGGRPEWLDDAVVRAGRLDVWLSWPQ